LRVESEREERRERKRGEKEGSEAFLWGSERKQVNNLFVVDLNCSAQNRKDRDRCTHHMSVSAVVDGI
jgi:hypothetical protein